MYKKIKIISDRTSYGPPPAFDDEVEQRISLNDNGVAVAVRYNSGGQRIGYKRIKITPELAWHILNKAERALKNYNVPLACDIGQWTAIAEDGDGNKYGVTGSLFAESTELTELSGTLRALFDLPLCVFDGETEIPSAVAGYAYLTKYIPLLKNLKEACVSSGSLDDEFAADVQLFAAANARSGLKDYMEILQSNNALPRRAPSGIFEGVEGMDEQCLYAVLIYCVRANRLSEGQLKIDLENGKILGVLERIEQIHGK